MKIDLPQDVKFILNNLSLSGYDAFVVGGCVRDYLLNLTPHDWDITTSAKPEIIKKLFSDYDIIDNGEKHGTIGVIINQKLYEITTYRIDGEYNDSRHPETVVFTDSINDDLSRRDFTINSIAYNEKYGFIDPFNGMGDLKLGAIRCVGVPDERFKEDALRILRAIRFASVYNFDIELNTAVAIQNNRLLLNNIAVERIATEFNKILCGDNVNYILRRYKEVFATFIPEILSTFNCEQHTPHHNKNVWKHTAYAVSSVENDLLLRMVMFMHDIGKPIAKKTDKKGIDHFKNHQRYSAELAKNILERLKYPRAFIDDVIVLVYYHDERNFENKSKLKKFLNLIGEKKFVQLIEVQKADISAQSRYKREEKYSNVKHNMELYKEIIENNECFTLKQLNISGSDLIHSGITKGIEIGEILNILLNEVICDNFENDKEALLDKAIMIHKLKY